jgi:hypothetical protein
LAGLIAAALVLAADVIGFRVLSPWRFIGRHADHWFYGELADDRIEIESIARRRSKPRVLLMGTSRMAQAWEPRRIDPPVPDAIRVFSIKHTQVYPPVIRAVADELRDTAPEVVLLGISEVDTHRVVDLGNRTAFPSARLYFEAARDLGPGWLFQERQGLYRYLLGDLVVGYDQRKIIGKMGLEKLRRFKTDRPARGAASFPDTEQERDVVERLERAGTYQPGEAGLKRALRFQVEEMSELSAGPHANAQMAFVRRAVETFRAGGSEVILFELPVSPAAADLFDGGLRAEFLSFAETLEAELGARLVPLEAHRPFRTRDFTDLTHLEPRRAAETTEAMLEAIVDALPCCVPQRGGACGARPTC